MKKVNGLKPIADELGVPLSQLAIAWCAANPNVSSVITGATKESQVSFTLVFEFMHTLVRDLVLSACVLQILMSHQLNMVGLIGSLSSSSSGVPNWIWACMEYVWRCALFY